MAINDLDKQFEEQVQAKAKAFAGASIGTGGDQTRQDIANTEVVATPEQTELVDALATRTNNTGINLPPPSQTLTPESLKEATTTTLPDIGTGDVQPPTDLSGANASAQQVIADIKQDQEIFKQSQTEVQKEDTDLSREIKDLIPGLAGRSAFESEQRQEKFGTLNKQLNSVNNQIEALLAEKEAFKVDQQGRPMTLSRLTGSIAQNNAKLNSEILMLSARANGLRGDLDLAEKQVQASVDEKYKPIEEALAIKQAQRDAIAGEVTKDEQRQLNALNRIDAEKKQLVADQKAKEVNIQNIMLKAVGSGITDQSILSKISNAGTVSEAIQIMGANIPVAPTVGLGGGGFETPTPEQVLPTFEDFVAQKEEQAGQSIANREQFRAEYNEAIAVAQDIPNNVTDIVSAINSGKITPATALTNVKDASLKLEILSALSRTTSPVDTSAQDAVKKKVSLIDNILDSSGLSGAVGPNRFARFRPVASLTGSTADFVSSVQQLTSQETLNSLINLKKAGGTLGALSDQERIMLKNSATKIGFWELEKDGKVYAYDVSQKAFKQELNTMKELANKAIQNSYTPVERITSDGSNWIANADGSFTQITL